MAHARLSPLVALLLVGGTSAAYDAALGPGAIAEAIRIGQSRAERVRADFHRRYRVEVRRPPVDSVDLVTPFRRVVLAAEERDRLGGRALRQQEAQAVLAGHGSTLDVLVELTFHPQNTYVGVPAYEVVLAREPPDRALRPRGLQRVPRFNPRLAGEATRSPYPAAPWVTSRGQPVLGGTLIASFDTGALDPRATYDVVVREGHTELARATMDLASLR